MRVFRIFPYDSSAADDDEGGALFVPRPSPLGRIANTGLYREVYFAGQPEAAVAEVFGFLQSWHPEDFIHAGGRRYCISSYEIADGKLILDLNETAALAKVGIKRPSHVVTRDRRVSRQWAQRVFSTGRYCGVSWWSYYCPDWMVYGVWDLCCIRHVGPPEELSPSHGAVAIAAKTIVRQVRH